MKKSIWASIAVASLLSVVSITLIAIQAQNSVRDAKIDYPLNFQLNDETNSAVCVEASKYPMKLTMTVAKTELDPGEPLHINFTLKNIGDQDLTMSFVDGREHFWFIIYDESESKSVYTHLAGYPQQYTPEVVSPNATRNKSWSWGQVGDLVYLGLFNDPPYYYKKILPGEYYIVGLFESHSLNLTIKTPSVPFTIHE